MPRHAIIIALLAFATTITAIAKDNKHPQADIKVGYTYSETFVRGSDGIETHDIPFVLLANSELSKFYSPATEFKDSLSSTSQGRAISRQILSNALKRYSETNDESLMNTVVYHTFLYIFRSKTDNEMTVYDTAGSTEHGYYKEPLEEIQWEIADSTKTVLGYECVMATADYHGREWTAWFSPDIPMQEGPWKLTGLPGLILEANDSTGQHAFTATGIESTNQEIYPIYPFRQYDKISRIDMLRQRRKYTDHRNSMNAAASGINFGHDHINSKEEQKIDFLETDYH